MSLVESKGWGRKGHKEKCVPAPLTLCLLKCFSSQCIFWWYLRVTLESREHFPCRQLHRGEGFLCLRISSHIWQDVTCRGLAPSPFRKAKLEEVSQFWEASKWLFVFKHPHQLIGRWWSGGSEQFASLQSYSLICPDFSVFRLGSRSLVSLSVSLGAVSSPLELLVSLCMFANCGRAAASPPPESFLSKLAYI